MNFNFSIENVKNSGKHETEILVMLFGKAKSLMLFWQNFISENLKIGVGDGAEEIGCDAAMI